MIACSEYYFSKSFTACKDTKIIWNPQGLLQKKLAVELAVGTGFFSKSFTACKDTKIIWNPQGLLQKKLAVELAVGTGT